MPHGSLEVFLVGAKGLEDQDMFFKMDPFVIITCRTQEQKSGVASGQGSEPVWNENFIFNLSEGVEEIKLKIMDSDPMGADFVGDAEIPLSAVFRERKIAPSPYNVVKDDKFCGEIKVGLTFTPEGGDNGDHGRDERKDRGWNQSSHHSHHGRDGGDHGRNERNDKGWNQSSHHGQESGIYGSGNEGGWKQSSHPERGSSGSDEDRRRGGSHGRRRRSSDED